MDARLGGILSVVAPLAAEAGEDKPYVARPLTRSGEFTKGIEGPCRDRDLEGSIYAVNFARERTAGRVTPEGLGEVFVTLPGRGVGNGIVPDSRGRICVADYVGHDVLRVDPETRAIAEAAPPPPRMMRSQRSIGRETTMTPQEKAESLGITFTRQEPGYLALVARTGNLLITSGHVSDLKGKLGAGLTVEQGKAAARECAAKVLNSIWNAHGTLDGLRVLKLLGCVNSTLEFDEQHLVINGCSDLLHEIYGKAGDGHHARSALGFAQLPTGAAVEVEAIFEIKA